MLEVCIFKWMVIWGFLQFSNRSCSTGTQAICWGKHLQKVFSLEITLSSWKWFYFLSSTFQWILSGILCVFASGPLQNTFPCRFWSYHTFRREPNRLHRCLFCLAAACGYLRCVFVSDHYLKSEPFAQDFDTLVCLRGIAGKLCLFSI